MKKLNIRLVTVVLLICGAIPINVQAQSAPTSTDDDTKKRSAYILSVTSINQHLFPSLLHDYDCFVASMLMALDFFDENITYNELMPTLRGNEKAGLPADPSFVFGVTEGRLQATGNYTNRLASVIENELRGGRPVVVAINNMSLLAENWDITTGHAVLVYGIYNGHIFYVDSNNGERYMQHTQPFINASTYPDGSFAITFEELNQTP